MKVLIKIPRRKVFHREQRAYSLKILSAAGVKKSALIFNTYGENPYQTWQVECSAMELTWLLMSGCSIAGKDDHL